MYLSTWFLVSVALSYLQMNPVNNKCIININTLSCFSSSGYTVQVSVWVIKHYKYSEGWLVSSWHIKCCSHFIMLELNFRLPSITSRIVVINLWEGGSKNSEAHLCVQDTQSSDRFSGSVTVNTLHSTSCPVDLQTRCRKWQENSVA